MIALLRFSSYVAMSVCAGLSGGWCSYFPYCSYCMPFSYHHDHRL